MTGAPQAGRGAGVPRPAAPGIGAEAVMPELFDRLMAALGPWGEAPRLAVAVSGGADSLALLDLTQDWARLRRGHVLAVHVDHRLRPESAAEAAWVARQVQRRGLACYIAVWDHGADGPPVAGLQARARQVRRHLLAAAARAAGCPHLLLAHHADDQAETIAMRAARAADGPGLAGMSAVRPLGRGLRLVRPLLPLCHGALVAHCGARGLAWLEDPSNADLRFERARLRHAAAGPPRLPADLAARQALRAAAERALNQDLARAVVRDGLGGLVLDLHAAAAAQDPPALLGRVLAWLGQRPHGLPRPRLLALWGRLLDLRDGARVVAQGAVLHRRGSVALGWPELRAPWPPPLPLATAEGRRFWRRFVVGLAAPLAPEWQAAQLVARPDVAPTTRPAAAALLRAATGERPPAARLAALPLVLGRDGAVHCPFEAPLAVALRLRLAPRHALTCAVFVPTPAVVR